MLVLPSHVIQIIYVYNYTFLILYKYIKYDTREKCKANTQIQKQKISNNSLKTVISRK